MLKLKNQPKFPYTPVCIPSVTVWRSPAAIWPAKNEASNFPHTFLHLKNFSYFSEDFSLKHIENTILKLNKPNFSNIWKFSADF